MPPTHRFTDVCTGHGCFPPRPNSGGSPDTFVNGLAQHRVTDPWEAHCCGPSCHGASSIEGSPDVFVNNLPACRVGDGIDCGSLMCEGSSDTFFN